MDSPNVANQCGIDSFATCPHPPKKGKMKKKKKTKTKKESRSKQSRKGANYQMVVIAGLSSSFIPDASLLEKNDLWIPYGSN